MAEQHDPEWIDPGISDDVSYSGPFPGSGPTSSTYHGGPDFSAPQPGVGPVYPPTAPASWWPAGPQPLPPDGPLPSPSLPVLPVIGSTHPGFRRRSVVGIAALTALMIGGGAGFGGALLAGRVAPAPTSPPSAGPPVGGPSTDPSPTDPSPTDPSPTEPTAEPVPPPVGSGIDAVRVAKRVLPSTVMISVGRSTGSGFVLDAKGRIMTNNHVVTGSSGTIKVTFADGRRQNATLVGRSPNYDIAVIKVAPSSRLKPISSGRSDRAQVGQSVLAIGSPLGLPGTVTQGILSARDRAVVVNGASGADPIAYINALQTDAPINPGNSGGPLVDQAGRVIGVNSAILSLGSQERPSGSIGLGFAIPMDQAKAIGAELIQKGRATYPVVGANVTDLSSGVALSKIIRQGPADNAGLRNGDVIIKIGGVRVTTSEELIVDIRTRRPGDTVTLDYRRGRRTDSVLVTLGSKVG